MSGPPISGARFGRFTVVRRIGQGGFGSVYEALLPGPMGFAKRVALKRLRAGRVDVGQVADEARIGGLLHHANIVDIIEFGEVDGRWYLAMEYVDGPDLARLLHLCATRGVLLPRFAVVELALQVCRGLHFAHELCDRDGTPLGLVHRDLKPSNIIVDRQGTAKVADFGIAKAASNLSESTSAGLVKGTPRYMSPEQITADGELTARSDLFSLGSVLFELVTGRRLFRAKTLPALVHELLEADLEERLDQAEASLEGCRPLLARALERDPERRYADARALADDLRTLARRWPFEVDLADVIERVDPPLEPTESLPVAAGELEEELNAEPAAEEAPTIEAEPTGEQPRVVDWLEFSAVFEPAPAPILLTRPVRRRRWPAVLAVLAAAGLTVALAWTSRERQAPTLASQQIEAVPVDEAPPAATPAEVAPQPTPAAPSPPARTPVARPTTPAPEPPPRSTPALAEPEIEPDLAPPAPPRAGSVTLFTEPWAHIWIDGTLVRSESRLKAWPLAGGHHVVRLVCPPRDGAEKVFEVDVDGEEVHLGCWSFDRMGPCERGSSP